VKGLLALLAIALTAAPALAGQRCRQHPATSADFLAPGPQAVGVRTLTLVDPSRATPPHRGQPGAPDRTLVTEVWYPASGAGGRDAALDASGGPYPVILYSHGFSAWRSTESHLAEHLARRGHVVAAPDFPLSTIATPGGPTIIDVPNQPGDLSFVLDQLLALSADGTSWLAGGVDGERVGAAGLSLGGLTTLLVGYHPTVRDPRVRAAFAMAPVGCYFTPRLFRGSRTPLFILHGDSDLLLPLDENGLHAFKISHAPHQLAIIRGGSHTGFTVFAAAFDPTKHYDRIGCDIVTANPDTSGQLDATPFEGLASRRQGVDLERKCSLPCTGPIVDPSLVATRQHELSKISIAAFFGAQLRGDVAARCFLRKGLEQENPELDVRGR
jgi:predicted dienelactone hydrolase